MEVVFRKKEYIIYHNIHDSNYIVYNTKKMWDEGHTHIHRLQQAHYLVDCCVKKKVPNRVNKYFLISLIRISKDDKYKRLIQQKLDNFQIKQNYYNRPKNFRV